MQRTQMISRQNHDWLTQMFHCQAARSGGVIRRQVVDVEREVGIPALLAEVQRRRFRLIRTPTHFVIVCTDGPIEIIC